MVHNCIVHSCINSERRASNQHGILFHSFPADAERLSQWISRIGAAHPFSPNIVTSQSKVCQMHFTAEDYIGDQSTHLKANAVPSLFESNMQSQSSQQGAATVSSAPSSPSPSITPVSSASSSHAVANLLNLNNANSLDQTPNSLYYGQAYSSPAIMAAAINAVANMPSYPYFDFANNFQQFIQHIDKKSKQDNEFKQQMDASTSSLNVNEALSSYSCSLGNTPLSSANSSFNKKRALAEVISKLRNQQNDGKELLMLTSKLKYEQHEEEADMTNENCESNRDDSDNEDEEDEDADDEAAENKHKEKTVSNDYQPMNEAEKFMLKTILNKVSPKPAENKSNNAECKQLSKKSEMDLFKLLERANLSQYLAVFTEQGMR